MGNFFKDLGKNINRIWDDIEAEAKRYPANVSKYGPAIAQVTQFIPGIGPVVSGAVQGHTMLFGEGGILFPGGGQVDESVMGTNPNYNVGSLPLGFGNPAAGTGGYMFGGSQWNLPGTSAAPSGTFGAWFEKYKTEAMIGAGLIVLILVMD